MPKLIIINRAGEERVVDAPNGLSMMEVIRDNGFDELLALCGGCCSCATCHIYVGLASGNNLSPMSDDENELLDSSSHRTIDSRLACQIVITDSLDGTEFIIAPED